MNNEVREILRQIESYENDELCLIVLSQKENKALLGYINNLQKEYKSKVDDIGKLTSRIYRAIQYMEETYNELTDYGYKEEIYDDLLNILQNGSGS